MSDAFKPILAKLAEGGLLSEDEAGAFFAACLRGEPSAAQIAAAITAMRVRRETVAEIVACAKAKASCTVIWSLRLTSGSAPSSHR